LCLQLPNQLLYLHIIKARLPANRDKGRDQVQHPFLLSFRAKIWLLTALSMIWATSPVRLLEACTIDLRLCKYTHADSNLLEHHQCLQINHH